MYQRLTRTTIAWMRLKKISVIAPKRTYFRVFRPTKHLKLHGKDIAKRKKRKEEVKQVPEKPSKELDIMEDISKSLQSTPIAMICLAWWLQQRSKIYPLRRKGKSNLKSTVCSSNTKKTMMLQQFHNHLRFRHHLRSRRMAIQTQIYPAFHWTNHGRMIHLENTWT